jgi:WD40 repeat protein
MSSPLLASIAESLKIWKYDNHTNVLSPIVTPYFAAGVDELQAISWNHTNQVVATAGAHQISLVHAQQGQLLSTIPFTDSSGGSPGGSEEPVEFDGDIRAVVFSSNSTKLASAAGTRIHIWDLRKRQLKAQLSGHRTRINSLMYLPNGDIVSGDNSGLVTLWDSNAHTNGLYTNMSFATATNNNDLISPLMCLKCSLLGSTKIAAGYGNGFLGVWDPKTASLVKKQLVCPTNSALTGLSFSPKNMKLIACCGMDGRLALIDISTHHQSDTPSAFIDVGHALTSIAFHEDAIRCVVGTQSGQLLMYDWRNIKKPVCSVNAHDYPVKAVAFQVTTRA